MRDIWYPTKITNACKLLLSGTIAIESQDRPFVRFFNTPTPGSAWRDEISLGLIWVGKQSSHSKTDEILHSDTLWDVGWSSDNDPIPLRNTEPRIYSSAPQHLYAAGIVYTHPPEVASPLWYVCNKLVQHYIRARKELSIE